MIHYSILPTELISYEWDLNAQSMKEVEVAGVKVSVMMNGEMEGTIVRVLSMNPMDFLNPRLSPGNKIKLIPQCE